MWHLLTEHKVTHNSYHSHKNDRVGDDASYDVPDDHPTTGTMVGRSAFLYLKKDEPDGVEYYKWYRSGKVDVLQVLWVGLRVEGLHWNEEWVTD